MEALTHIWRPRQSIRAVALGLPFRDERLLVSAVTEDDGTTKGWRPLGGGVEFGETAEAAVQREFEEEIQAKVDIRTRLGTIENIYTHQGETGHEVIFAFVLDLIDPGLASEETFIVEDSGFRDQAAWLPLADFRNGSARLLPDGLLPLVPVDRAP